ncbi:hypothetical protein HYZ41_03215 [archaeon]|nr:hypothetical protein [archaeon]
MDSEEQWQLVKSRIQEMPPHMKISIGNTEYNKDDILEHVEKRDEIGKLIFEIEMTYLKMLKTL